MICKMSVWAWYCDAPQGGYLFHSNPNVGMPPFHLGGIENIVYGERLVWEHRRGTLEMNISVSSWNNQYPKFRVTPRLITLELRPADPATRSRRKKKGGDVK